MRKFLAWIFGPARIDRELAEYQAKRRRDIRAIYAAEVYARRK